MDVIDKTDNIEQIKERLIKAVSNLDKALSRKLMELEEANKRPVVDIKKFEDTIAQKSQEAEEAKQKAAELERENAELKAELAEEKAKNQKLVKFGSDISDKVEGMVKQLELVING